MKNRTKNEKLAKKTKTQKASKKATTKLEIQNLFVEVEGKEILRNVNLELNLGDVVALMGPNGSGKSTLANTIMGNPKYKIVSGKIILNGEDITQTKVDERARKGLFMSFQYPKEISGLTLSTFLRTALNVKRKNEGNKILDVVEFHKLLKLKMADLGIDSKFANRNLNEGFSGGEKKRCEILQLSLLEPKYAILDETDSGLDVDALKIVAKGIVMIKQNLKKEGKDMGILIITHYNKILDYIVPNKVVLIQNGKIGKTGGKELAKEIEKKGFKNDELVRVGKFI